MPFGYFKNDQGALAQRLSASEQKCFNRLLVCNGLLPVLLRTWFTANLETCNFYENAHAGLMFQPVLLLILCFDYDAERIICKIADVTGQPQSDEVCIMCQATSLFVRACRLFGGSFVVMLHCSSWAQYLLCRIWSAFICSRSRRRTFLVLKSTVYSVA